MGTFTLRTIGGRSKLRDVDELRGAAGGETIYHVFGYAMFTTTTERDAVRTAVQNWLDAHTTEEAWPSSFTINIGMSFPYNLPAGIATPALMDLADPQGGPWPGLTWSYQTATADLRDSFGDAPWTGTAPYAAALEGSLLGEQTQ